MYTQEELAKRKDERAARRAEEKALHELRILTWAAKHDQFDNWMIFQHFHMNWSYMSAMVRGWWKDGLTLRLAKDGRWLPYVAERDEPFDRGFWNHNAVYRWVGE